MKDPTNFVSLSGQTHSGLQQFFAKPSFTFVLCFGNNDHTFSWVDWKWHVCWHALHTIHQWPREFLRRTVSSSCNLARVEGTLQCKDDQRPHLFSLSLGGVWWTQQVLWSLGILQPAMLFLRLVAHYAIHSHPLHRLIIQEQLRLYDCPHYSCFCWVMHGLLTVTYFASSRMGQSPHAVGIN